jgi:hypothetical protein
VHGNPLNIYWIHFRVIISKQTQIFIWQQCVEIGKWHKTRLLIHCFQRRFIYIFICNEQFIDHLVNCRLCCQYHQVRSCNYKSGCVSTSSAGTISLNLIRISFGPCFSSSLFFQGNQHRMNMTPVQNLN